MNTRDRTALREGLRLSITTRRRRLRVERVCSCLGVDDDVAELLIALADRVAALERELRRLRE